MHLTYGPDFKFYLLPSFSFTLDTSPIYKGMPYLCLDCLIVLCFSSHHGYLCLGLGSNAFDCTCVLTWIDHCLVNNSSITGGSRGTSLSSVELPRIIPTKYPRLCIDTERSRSIELYIAVCGMPATKGARAS